MYHVNVRHSKEVRYRFEQPTSKIVCVGRNYAAHATELNNPIPKSPLLFIKSTNCLVDLKDEILIPTERGECHHELEIAILIGESLTSVSEVQSLKAISAVGIGLDLTLRDLQSKLKSKGQPWEKAKNFDGSCPLSDFVDINYFMTNLSKDKNGDLKSTLNNIDFELIKNNQLVQKGNTQDMIFGFSLLISDISKHFTLYPGDVILTGTPEGVAELKDFDKISASINGVELAKAEVKGKK